jgi:hypothetical protein
MYWTLPASEEPVEKPSVTLSVRAEDYMSQSDKAC